jgi:hypothetical protein
MKPIKCLLLLAAVAFAAMNAAAMNNNENNALPQTISGYVRFAIDDIRDGRAHGQNWALGQLIGRAQEAIDAGVQMDLNPALTGLVIVVEFAAERETEHNHPNMYVAQDPENEDAEICRSADHMGYLRCVSCCLVEGHRNQARWLARPQVYMDFQGRCSCVRTNGNPPSDMIYEQSRKIINGEVIDPVQRNRNNRI